MLLRLLEHVAHARGTDADEHLDEIRTGDREERHLASPAIALASSVLPVPGLPVMSTPLGMWPPSFWNLDGSRRNSTSSPTSSLASSTPATSSKVVLFCSSVSMRALLLPKPMARRVRPRRLHLAHEEHPHAARSSSIGPADENLQQQATAASVGVWVFFMRQMQGGGADAAVPWASARARRACSPRNRTRPL